MRYLWQPYTWSHMPFVKLVCPDISLACRPCLYYCIVFDSQFPVSQFLYKLHKLQVQAGAQDGYYITVIHPP